MYLKNLQFNNHHNRTIFFSQNQKKYEFLDLKFFPSQEKKLIIFQFFITQKITIFQFFKSFFFFGILLGIPKSSQIKILNKYQDPKFNQIQIYFAGQKKLPKVKILENRNLQNPHIKTAYNFKQKNISIILRTKESNQFPRKNAFTNAHKYILPLKKYYFYGISITLYRYCQTIRTYKYRIVQQTKNPATPNKIMLITLQLLTQNIEQLKQQKKTNKKHRRVRCTQIRTYIRDCIINKKSCNSQQNYVNYSATVNIKYRAIETTKKNKQKTQKSTLYINTYVHT
eukprot:TRINITY_DN2826_c0_g1_i2.p2 TRINITY_DN2826_c0_g1~~TRINITY_DN2826_c0_g1_i2.p2  ORF type:complete len:284 (+),score=-0.85 TRINITY_DN2826_c0_g1_i2:1081-1932(+)